MNRPGIRVGRRAGHHDAGEGVGRRGRPDWRDDGNPGDLGQSFRRESVSAHLHLSAATKWRAPPPSPRLEIIETEDLPAQSAIKGEKLLRGLKEIQTRYPDLLEEARGRGLMIGVEFADSDIGKLAIGALVKNGVIAAYTLNNPEVIRFEPPLVITDAQIDRVLLAFDAALRETQELIDELLG